MSTYEFFTIEYHHGGIFRKENGQLKYVGGHKYVKDDHIIDEFCKWDIKEVVVDTLKYNNMGDVFYKIPGKSLAQGIRPIVIDQDILDMVGSLGPSKRISVYVSHGVDQYQGELDVAIERGVEQEDDNAEIPIVTENPTVTENHATNTSELHVESPSNTEIPNDPPPNNENQNSPPLNDNYSADVNLEDEGSDDEDCDGSDFEVSEGDYDDGDDECEAYDLEPEMGNEIKKNLGTTSAHGLENTEDLPDVAEDSDCNTEELKSLNGSDEEQDTYPEFNPDTDLNKPIEFKLGLRFATNEILRKALKLYAIQKNFDFYYLHNDKKRITIYCRNRCKCADNFKHGRILKCQAGCVDVCRFKIHAKRLRDEDTFQIKSMKLKHQNCGGLKDKVSKVSAEWLAERYQDNWRGDPDWKLTAFIEMVHRDYGVTIGGPIAYRAKHLALFKIHGDASEQYKRVWDYAEELRRTNPGSTCLVRVDITRQPSPIFQRLYVCLSACKEGFVKGCRPLIGIDGCHLKGIYTGQILSAVGKDGNGNIFPIAYAIVEVENKDTWSWFLHTLISDLGPFGRHGWCFMSDRQKGLIEALQLVVPQAEVRFCARHMHANFKQKWAGKSFKDVMWKACRAYTKFAFDEAMKEMKNMDESAFNYLMAVDPSHWSRHAFREATKSDCLLNNMCESFNKMIIQARDKPILTAMEYIRRLLMKRFIVKQESISQFEGGLVPKAQHKIEQLKKEIRYCVIRNGGGRQFEVDHNNDTFVVDVDNRCCGCRAWQLNGFPCIHGVACLVKNNWSVEEYVHEAYTKEMYMVAYGKNVAPLPGMKHWPMSQNPHPAPPPNRKMPGRPKRTRKRETGEQAAASLRVKRRQVQNRCTQCGQLGHNKKTCKNSALSRAPQSKGGRPKKSSVGPQNTPRTYSVGNQNTPTCAQDQDRTPSLATTPPTEDFNPFFTTSQSAASLHHQPPMQQPAAPVAPSQPCRRVFTLPRQADRGNVCFNMSQVREAAEQVQKDKGKNTSKPVWRP